MARTTFMKLTTTFNVYTFLLEKLILKFIFSRSAGTGYSENTDVEKSQNQLRMLDKTKP